MAEDEDPSDAALNWVGRVTDGSRIIHVKRLTGGISSSVHDLTLEDQRGSRSHLVLRHWQDDPSGTRAVALEEDILTRLAKTDLPTPHLIAADHAGHETNGEPVLLMTRLPGRIDLSPKDPSLWLRQMAVILARIHDAEVKAPTYESWLQLDNLHVPPWAQEPDLWQRAIDLILGAPAPFVPTFIHRDYQHFNLLWVRGRLSGIVDWIDASTGPMDVDTGHCRLNLAVLCSAASAERFRMAYEAEAGRQTDPWYDIASLLEYLPGWGPGLDLQIGNRALLDRKGMHARVEELLKQAMGRL